MPRLKFVKTGMSDIDEKILANKGLPRPGTIYILGHPGVGKTTFAATYLVNRAKEGEKGVYVSLIESKELFIEHFREFSFYNDLAKFIENNTIYFAGAPPIYGYDSKRILDLFENVGNLINSLNAKNLVIDSINALTLYLKMQQIRTLITRLYHLTIDNDLTIILIGELPLFSTSTYSWSEEFIADIVLLMDYVWIISGVPRLAVRLVPVKSRMFNVAKIPYEVQVDYNNGLKLIHELIEPYVPFAKEVSRGAGYMEER